MAVDNVRKIISFEHSTDDKCVEHSKKVQENQIQNWHKEALCKLNKK